MSFEILKHQKKKIISLVASAEVFKELELTATNTLRWLIPVFRDYRLSGEF